MHLAEAKDILLYIKGTLGMVYFSLEQIPVISVFSDVSWAGCMDDQCSTKFICLFLGSFLLFWSAEKQYTVSQVHTKHVN